MLITYTNWRQHKDVIKVDLVRRRNTIREKVWLVLKSERFQML